MSAEDRSDISEEKLNTMRRWLLKQSITELLEHRRCCNGARRVARSVVSAARELAGPQNIVCAVTEHHRAIKTSRVIPELKLLQNKPVSRKGATTNAILYKNLTISIGSFLHKFNLVFATCFR